MGLAIMVTVSYMTRRHMPIRIPSVPPGIVALTWERLVLWLYLVEVTKYVI